MNSTAAMAEAFARADSPAVAQIDVTYRCDLDCQHCYLDNRDNWPELTGAEWRSVIDQLAALNTLILKWSGGDVSQRHDFDDLLAHAAGRGFVQEIKTHAGNIDAATASRWAAWRVARVDVSVYSLVPAVHDAFTRRRGSLEATLRGIGHLRAAGLAVKAVVPVRDEMVEEIPAMHAHLTGLGCQAVFSTTMFRDHSATANLDHLELSPQARVRANELIWRHARTEEPLRSPVSERPGSQPCGAGRTLVYITPDGGVWPCVMFPMQLGNLRQATLAAIWSQSAARQQLKSWTNDHRGACQSCAGSGLCFFCPGEAFKNSGDFRIAPAIFHQRTHLAMRGYEAARGPTWTAEQWATVPESAVPRPPRPDKFVFPIYRPRKGQGARVAAPNDRA